MQKNNDDGIFGWLYGSSAAVVVLAAINWGYHYTDEFNATVTGYKGEVSCKAAAPENCVSDISGVIVTNKNRDQFLIPLERSLKPTADAAFPYPVGSEVKVTHIRTPNDGVRFHQERLSLIEGASLTLLEP